MSLVAAAEEDLKAGRHMALADKRFLLQRPDSIVPPDEKIKLKRELMDGIKENNMSVFYEECCSKLGWNVDQTFLNTMKKANEEKLKELAEQLEKAKESEGEVEILDARTAKADFYFLIGDKSKSVEAIDEIPVESMSTGTKIDAVLKHIRVGLFHMDKDILKQNIAKAKTLIEKGGDWERRNRLKIYEASYQMIMRDFEGASENLMSSIATFTCYEVMTYNTFVSYAVLLGMLTLKRGDLKKIIDSDVLTVIRELPVGVFLNAMYDCDYKVIYAYCSTRPYSTEQRFAEHTHYYIKEMRVAAYTI